MSIPCFLDFEATGLGPHSYPIEVAWSVPTGEIHSALIRPSAEWARDGEWDPSAEALHQISRMHLTQGVAARTVAQKLNAGLGGQTVYVDAPAYDRWWLAQLCDAAALGPAFDLRDAVELLAGVAGVPMAQRVDWYEAMLEKARASRPDLQPHRAAADVEFMQLMYRAGLEAPGG